MVGLLERILIKDRDNAEDAKVRSAYGMLCGFVGIGLNVVLFLAKLFAGYACPALQLRKVYLLNVKTITCFCLHFLKRM